MGDFNLAAAAGYQIPQGEETDWGGAAIDLLKMGAGELGGDEVEMAIAAWDAGAGAIDLIDGLTGETDGVQAMNGVNDIVGAGFGLLPGGEAYELTNMFLSPLFFGNDAWTNRPKVEEMGVDGTSNPSCGNSWIDAIGDTLSGGSESLVGAAGFHEGLNGWNPPD
jgi:hypothetical protein